MAKAVEENREMKSTKSLKQTQKQFQEHTTAELGLLRVGVLLSVGL